MRTASILWPSTGARERVALQFGAEKNTFGELECRSNQLANALVARGFDDNGRIALLCSNGIEFVETMLAAEKAGLRATIINPTAGPRHMEAALRCCDPHVVVANVSAAVDVTGAISNVAAKLFVGGAPGFEDYETVLGNQPSVLVADRPRGIPMPLTSGTTGLPKAVYRKQAYIPPYLRQLLAVTAFADAEDVAFAPCGLQGSGVYNLAVGLPLKAGVRVVIPDIVVTTDLDPEEVLRTIETERVTHMYMPNYIMRRLLALPEQARDRYDLASLKCVLHTGSPCPIAIKAALIEWLGPIVTEIYAGAEGSGTLITAAEWLEHKGSVGKPTKELVKIVKTDLADAPAGRIYFRSPKHQRFEYFRAKDATEEVFCGDYFTLGDLGYVDDEGYLYLTGRSSEAINFSGYNVFPSEIDETLIGHPAVAACAAVGLPDDVMGEIVGAVIVLRDGYSASAELTKELLDWCHDMLSMSKCPQQIAYCADIPGFAQGKVNRRALRGLFRSR